jgi:TRAP-type C4-dicarboxylate transport system substrate-binding protein
MTHPLSRRGLAIAALLVVQVACQPAAFAQQTLRLTFASGYPPTFLFVQEMQRNFAEEMNRELARNGNRYRIEWNFALAGTLAKIPAMLEAMETGQAEFGHVSHLFAPGKLPLQNVDGYTPFAVPDHRIAGRVAEELVRDVPAVREQYARLGLVYLSSFPLDDYVLVSKTPIGSMADLRGRKVGGAGANLNWLQGTGAVGVTTTGAQAYTDLKNGVFDSLLTPLSFVINAKYYEVAPHIVKVRFNALNAGQIVANKAAFDRLPAEVQRAAVAAAATFRTRYAEAMDRTLAEAEKTIAASGGRFSEFPSVERAKWAFGLPNLAENWARELDAKGVPASAVVKAQMAALRRAGVEPVRAWDR